jgi:hypothetical protein
VLSGLGGTDDLAGGVTAVTGVVPTHSTIHE